MKPAIATQTRQTLKASGEVVPLRFFKTRPVAGQTGQA